MKKLTPVKAVLVLFFLYVFCLGSHAQVNYTCYDEIHVKRNTAWRVVEMSTLIMNCPMKYCEPPPTVTWCRLDADNTCTPLPENPNVEIWQESVSNEDNLIISYMEIKKTTKDYSGLYRCGVDATTTGHSISVTVTGVDQLENTTHNYNTISLPGTNGPALEWLPYVFICGGIVTVVMVVMLISFLSLHGCKRSSRSHSIDPTGPSHKTEQIAEAQCPTRRSSARVTPSPSVPRRDRSLRCHPTQSPALSKATAYDHHHLNETQSLHGLLTLPRAPPTQSSPSNHRSALLTQSQGSPRDRRPSQVLYAALDHLAPRDAPRTVPKFQPEEEFSEYASIRLS
ncbi:B- and T-lymphocyte attenuator isoform X1 [Alosa sapidissima]|uniref:B- and T-lymphocyte attenuator isoform X1 n=2 Tax=Alosa sapidissima TaxID=34773 RepID=UPI001C08504E|nr:B- and T-lymphocyte attenuator isoform X1 [Alosa sapidissima]XP_041938777.1 B- and T-lymphocyte attenuator isoform X1 [Alosa sapidissima]